ncbi:MAG TPA: cytochrome c maturation protein CcmE [Kofleriaceae bacterium]
MPRALVVKVMFTTVAHATLLGVLWYAAVPPEPSYLMVDELVRDPARWQGRELKVHGWVLAGSIRPLPRDGGYTLLLQRGGQILPVLAAGPRPDLVTDQAELVITGRLWHGVTPHALHPDALHPDALAATAVNTRCARDYGRTHPAAAEPEYK